MAKNKSVYVCSNCGDQESKWMGRCPSCGEWNTMEEQEVATKSAKTVSRVTGAKLEIKKLTKVSRKSTKRVSTGFAEFDAVLGEGLLPGQVILFSGEPGIGKSTLLLQSVVETARKGLKPLYISAEESELQVADRGVRLFKAADLEKIDFASGGGLHSILDAIDSGAYDLLVIDSIQTIFDENLNSLPGSLSQIKSCASEIIDLAKRKNVITIIIGHINKDGNIAGPKVLEHLVDSVLQLDGERNGEYRVLRSLKNRFGPTGEVGMFVMEEQGMRDITPQDNVLAGDSESAVGVVKTVALEGNKPIILEVQALTNKTVFAYPKRVAEGVSGSRLQLLCAIIERFGGVDLSDKDVYVRTAGSYKLQSTVADLGLAVAIISSIKNKKLPPDSVFVGELALSGKLYLSNQVKNRLKSLAKQGSAKIYTPQLIPGIDNKQQIVVHNLKDLFSQK